MKKTTAIILSLIIALGTLASCGKQDESEPTTTTSPTITKESEENVTAYKRDLKSVDLKTLTIDYCGYVYKLYSHGGVDFCSDYYNDNSETIGLYAFTADKEILLTDQKIEDYFSIIKSRIYYYEILEEYKKADGIRLSYEKVAVWVMDLDGSNKKKLYDSEYKDILVVYADDNYLYFTCNGVLSTNEEFVHDKLCRFDLKTKKIETIVDNAYLRSCTYHDGKIFFLAEKQVNNNEICCIRSYDLENGKITEIGAYSNYGFVDDDLLLVENKKDEKILYSLSQNKELDAGVFSVGTVRHWDRCVTIETTKANGDEENIFYCGNGKTEKLHEPSNPNYYRKCVLNADEQIYVYRVSDVGKIKYQVVYMNKGKEAIIGESEWFDDMSTETYYDVNIPQINDVGEFVTPFSNCYGSIRY